MKEKLAPEFRYLMIFPFYVLKDGQNYLDLHFENFQELNLATGSGYLIFSRIFLSVLIVWNLKKGKHVSYEKPQFWYQ